MASQKQDYEKCCSGQIYNSSNAIVNFDASLAESSSGLLSLNFDDSRVYSQQIELVRNSLFSLYQEMIEFSENEIHRL